MSHNNILLLTIDTLRADRLGCYGYDRPITPALDRLADGGIRFDQAITGGSWTQAAFPTILTSSYASAYGGCLGPLAASRPSPIEALAGCGYRTFGFSSSPLLSRRYAYDRGFTAFKDSSPGEKDPWLRRIKGGERLLRHRLPHQILGLLGARTRPARLYLSAEEIAAGIDEWLVPGPDPFFGWVHYMDVHWPYHREEALRKPEEIAAAWRDIAHLYRVNRKGDSITSAQMAHYQALYEEAIAYTDEHVGRLMDTLEERGLLENTIVIVVSDHGEEFLERSRWGHFELNLHDEIVHVPLIFHGPTLPAGLTVAQQVSTLDIMPTVLDLAGCPAPSGMEGVSLVPLWRDGSPPDGDRIAISEMWRDHLHIVSARTLRYKYIWSSRTPEEPRLFDLQHDPGERRNVVDEHPETADFFRSFVREHLAKGVESALDRPVEAPDHDGEMIRRLRDLGYLD